MDETKNSGISFPIPHLKSGRSPASVLAVTLYKSDETSAMMRIDITRDLSVKLESFTFKYRFSALPFDEPDSRHNWHSFVYTDEDMNEKPNLLFNGRVPSKMKLEGCTAYVSEVRLTDGRVYSYPLSEFTDRDDENDLAELEKLIQKQPDQPEKYQTSKPKKKISTKKLAVALTVIFFSIIIESIAGVYIFNYVDAKKAAEVLMTENRWNEAYKLVLDKGYKGLLQTVCERASDYYYGEDDFEQAYVYSRAAPNNFTDKVMENAAKDVVDPATGTVNENAYRVAKMAADDGKFSEIVHSMITILENKEDYPNALRVASELRGDNDRARSEKNIFSDAIKFYLSEHKFEGLVAFIEELGSVRSFSASDKEIADAIIAYSRSSGDSSGLIYFSTRYPDLIDLTSIDVTVKPDDSGIRSALGVIWNLLSADQKRTYLSRSIALDKEQFVISDGRISGVDAADIVSVATGEFNTIALLKDGSVKLISDRYKLDGKLPGSTDIIGIAAGEKHVVMLHSDGTVSAAGDNSYGQCEVAAWSDIVEVAAGQYFTLGLRSDGRVVAAGSNSAGQCEVDGFNNVASIAAGGQTAVLLFDDGTVRLAGYRSYGLAGVEKESNVTNIRAGWTTVVVKHKDGRFRLYSGSQSGNPGSVDNWQNISEFAVGNECVAAIDESGRFYSSGDGVPRTDIVQ